MTHLPSGNGHPFWQQDVSALLEQLQATPEGLKSSRGRSTSNSLWPQPIAYPA